ncbi:hypothetical protein GR925_27435 [Streptomyces sp. HUCO-GS316]|uniref:C2H2-type zinc finger protein n=1 Tax=Streptomyces sp. HUCO-GS316 TaxID=2692198 RepID=UPI0013712321|nr:C2H2-type zinc finger protein [Streptomyces sp. HUCO-GS316]MXM67062.1 hypothetical protein [Streptomyces sp. HUCO-GS316]
MSSTIRVQPAARRRQEFALWATAQSPKVRTVAPNTFAVPGDLFADIPEEALIGALIDGQRYVPPADTVHDAAPPVLPEREAIPGEPLPELPESAYGPDSVPLPPPDFAPLEDAPADDQGPASDGSDPSDSSPDAVVFECPDCEREYSTQRGLRRHRSNVHGGN